LLDGAPVDRVPRAAVARRLAYVPQAAPGGFAYPAREVVAMGRAARLPLLSAPGARDRAVAEAALARLGVGHLSDRPVTEISGGERQLVLLARALAQEAAALVMDEPTASLDFGNQALVLRQVRSLAERDGLAVLMTTHHPDHAFLVADDAALLHRGALSGPAPPEALVTPALLREVYGVEAAVGALDTPAGLRRVCVPLVFGSVP
jgi:iron complex transport system ATP-binding protein